MDAVNQLPPRETNRREKNAMRRENTLIFFYFFLFIFYFISFHFIFSSVQQYLALDRPLQGALDLEAMAPRVKDVVQPDKVVHLVLATAGHDRRRKHRSGLIRFLFCFISRESSMYEQSKKQKSVNTHMRHKTERKKKKNARTHETRKRENNKNNAHETRMHTHRITPCRITSHQTIPHQTTRLRKNTTEVQESGTPDRIPQRMAAMMHPRCAYCCIHIYIYHTPLNEPTKISSSSTSYHHIIIPPGREPGASPRS